MSDYLILRRIETGEQGTFGELLTSMGSRLAVTCERPDNNNQKMGCIPVGEYQVTRFDSPSKGKVFLLHDVLNRSMIEIHIGNTIKDTEGCILVGKKYGYFNGVKGISDSAVTLHSLLDAYTEPFTLKVIEKY